MPRYAINIVTYNSADRIDGCLDSVFAQDWPDYRVTVIDNASTDHTLTRLASWRERGVQVVTNAENAYYARAHNQALRVSDAEFVLTLNPDVLLRPDFLTRVDAAFATSDRIGSVNGKLLLVAPDRLDPSLLAMPPEPDATIDSAGLTMRRSRRPNLRGNRRLAATECLEPATIFGVDGAAAVYRRTMLDDVSIEGEVFDEDFAIYREDVDLAWRCQLLGWDSHYEPSAIGYHIRGFHVGQSRRGIPSDLKRHSVKNGWLLLLKNDDLSSLVRALPWVAPYQLKILGGLVAVERSSLGAIWETFRLLPRMRRKRTAIQARRQRSATELRRWFG